MTTPALSPQKKPMPPMESTRRVSSTLTAEGTATAAAALGLFHKAEPVARRTGATTGAGMLITPAKTPVKPPNEKVRANVRSVARNLFHSDEEEMATTPSKTRTQPREPETFYLHQEVDQSFEIYTDSHERVPEVDKSSDNPFYVGQHPAAPEPARRRSKRNMVTIPGEGKVSVDEAVRRDDGMLIVFRGKKQFRKFSDMEEPAGSGLDEGDGGLESAVESPTRRHFTRSSIKPRLLFPVGPDESQHENSDEEAATDIEDHVLAGIETDKPETPLELVDEVPGTPEAPRFAPASPPTTARTTRFGGKKAADTTPVKPTKPSKRSPFDSWRRVKGGASTSHKRSGEDLAATSSKRTRA
ncbi:hypothetical protein N0V88_005403 [Collariella sp. IMI 366227]|nr:hypothetical protein N0V88_005403 [Collariella sp. IMI 366227]